MALQKIKLDSAIYKTRMREHDNIKKQILDIIETQSNGRRIYDSNFDDLDITKCDYVTEGFHDSSHRYLPILRPHLLQELNEILPEMGYTKFHITNIWYQQYETDSVHGWHVHTDCQFSAVYYLELPESCPKTEFVIPFDQKETLNINVKEGDIVIFPSYCIHRAPKNTSTERKTIISWNSNYENDSSGAVYG